ncbi:MAG: histidine kinase [Chloroflexales bacterium]|nr:histidine kinase [Chloroflexales bacterium]
MFRGLRLQLTLLYALSALALVALVGGGAYLMVARHERGLTDLGLQHKMAHELHALGVAIPAELTAADRDWSLVREELGLLPFPRRRGALTHDEAAQIAVRALGGGAPASVDQDEEDGQPVYQVHFGDGTTVTVDPVSRQVVDIEVETPDEDDDEAEAPDEAYDHPDDQRREESHIAGALVSPAPVPQDYDGELAAIYVLPLDQSGLVWVNPSVARPPVAPDRAALDAALTSGSDLRTITTTSGQRVRLLTYRLTGTGGPVALQLGRALDDQDQLLQQLVIGLLALGTLGMALVGAGSWWLAGRALYPAQAAWEQQQRFIASASHELRTPLTLIRTSTELLKRWTARDATDQHELLADVLGESDHMRRLVDDLLTVTRIDSGRLRLITTSVELPTLLVALHRQTARLGEERGVSVALGEVAGVVQADPDWLRQVLLNLIDNALRHTSAGGQIRLTARPHGRTLRISVTDTGCGIAPEHLPYIFDRFYRADPARGRAGGNAGLGLSIAKGLVEQMGGQIGAESVLGQGTTIWLAFPAA